MDPIDIQVRALVKDAVGGLDLVNDKIDDQQREVYKLAKAQHDLETSALRLADAQKRLANSTDPAAQHELEGAVLDARVALDKQQKEVDDLARSYQGFNAQTQESKISITDFKSAIDLTRDGVELLGNVYDKTIKKFAEWGDAQGDLAALTGMTVEQTSLMSATFELVGVEGDDLSKVLKSLSKQGIALTTDSLIDLNRQYHAIKDPVERAQFLFKNFGRAGEDMAEIMGRDTRELEALAEAARKSGKVIGGEAADQAETFNTQLAIAQQKVDGLGIAVGGFLLSSGISFSQWMKDAITDAANLSLSIANVNSPLAALTQGILVSNSGLFDFAAAFDASSSKITTADLDTQAYSRSSAIAASDIQTFTDAQADLNAELSDLNAIIGGQLGPNQDKYYDTQSELATQARDLKTQIEQLKETDGQYYQQVRSNGMTAAEVALANEKLARAYAQLSEETDPLKIAQLNVEIEKQQTAISGASETVDGYIDNSKKISELESEYDAITDKIDENRDAHEKATARIVFGFILQKAAAEGFKNLSITELAEIGQAWGIYDETTATALAAVDKAVSEHGANAQSVIDALGGSIMALPTEKTFTYKIRVDNPNNVAVGAEVSDDDFSPSGPPASPVTPINPSPQPENIPGRGGGFALGGSFTVPGSGGGDRPYLVQLTPGERVDVTPVGKRASGEGTIIKIERGAIVINGDGKTAKQIAEETLTEVAARARALANAGRQYSRG